MKKNISTNEHVDIVNHNVNVKSDNNTKSNTNNPATIKPPADSWSRAAVATNYTKTGGGNNNNSVATGRGSLSGWTLCPLCGKYSNKKYARGRGISNHIMSIHTPWKPTKLAQKIHRRKYEAKHRTEQIAKRIKHRWRPQNKSDDALNENDKKKSEGVNTNEESKASFEPLTCWIPTDEEKKLWEAKLLKVLRQIGNNNKIIINDKNSDKSGKPVVVYEDSLPPFIMAASKGDLIALQTMVDKAKQKDKIVNPPVQNNNNNDNKNYDGGGFHHRNLRILLNTSDRHKSIADHWAAGGGYLDCLKFLYEVRSIILSDTLNAVQQRRKKQKIGIRRRDGKTCLHYAARNGKIDCIQFLLEKKQYKHLCHEVDEKSGDGTTPLHLACYGGHPITVRYLIETYGADVSIINDWGCSCSHWAAMTISKSIDSIRELCRYLYQVCEISFVTMQGQGHTALHKAAHRQNRHVIKWMAEPEYSGGAGLQQEDKIKAGEGHKPSDIWTSMGGDKDFAEWMIHDMGW